MRGPSRLMAECIYLLAALMIIAPGASAQAAYPPPAETWVNDFSGRLSASDAGQIRRLLKQIHQDTGVEATVVVVDSIHDYQTGDDSIESFATHLFNDWGVGDAARNDGVLFLVALGDRQVRIELGEGHGTYNSALMARILDDQVLPAFKRGRIADGIQAGIHAALAELTDWRPPAVAEARRELPPAPQAAAAGGLGVFGSGLLLLLVSVSLMGWGSLFLSHRRKNTCPDCGHRPLTRKTRRRKKISYVAEEVKISCSRCRYKREELNVLPRRSASRPRGRSTSSHGVLGSGFHGGGGFGGGGGSSFGGGSSSGGGASGSW